MMLEATLNTVGVRYPAWILLVVDDCCLLNHQSVRLQIKNKCWHSVARIFTVITFPVQAMMIVECKYPCLEENEVC